MEAQRDDPARTVASPTPQLQSFASGRYLVRRLLGEGGQKIVFLAHDSLLDREVAVALLKADSLDTLGIARVQREAQTMARLGPQPHIVTIFDMGEYEGRPFIVCEYMAGGDLHQELRRAGGALAMERAFTIAQDLGRALVVAHGREILHRDIKPSNIWLTKNGSAKLGDFGLARALGRSRITQAGTIMGTAAYMAPEQALGGDVDARSDLYSLGCLLYELVTGRPPFLGDDMIAVISQHINTAPVAPRWHRREVPKALEALIVRLMAKAPEKRPASAAEVLEALISIAAAPAGAGAPMLGDANSLDRLAGGVFVGREAETQQIRSALDRALSGQGNLALLAGEPGIGKTRLATELATYASVRGAQVLWGRCYEGEGAPAYWPWVQVIRSYVHDRDPAALLSEMGPGAADIAQVVSEVRERLPDVPAPASLAPEQARFRFFDSITTFLKNASRNQPLILVLDDLHWADKPSLLLLQFLARELGGARLLVVGTYRDVEVRRQHPLSSTLAELAREQLSQRVVLRGLSELDVARFIEMASGLRPPEALVNAVYKETEGNPFFVKEIVSLLAREGRLDKMASTTSWTVAIPQSVREVVGRRLADLSEECNRVLTIAAVIGREFDLQTLEQIAGPSGDTVLDLLDVTVAARIIAELPDAVGRYSFSHALIRETLYEELTAARRARLHRQIGDVLEQAYASRIEPHLGELAYHFFEAARGGGDMEKAIDYATRAGQRAMTLLGFEEAACLYELALETLDLNGEPDDMRRCELLLALGDAQNKAGDIAKARETFLRDAGVARTLKAPEQLAQAALGLGWYPGVPSIVDEVLIGLLEEALGALREEDGALRARVLGRLASALFLGASQRRHALAREAIEMARRVGDRPALAYTLDWANSALHDPETLGERLAAATELVRLAEETDDKVRALNGHLWRLTDLLELGEIAAVDLEIDAFTQLADELRQPFFQSNVVMLRAMRALLDGRLEEGEALARQALALGQRGMSVNAVQAYAVQMFLVRREQGRLAEMEAGLKAFVDQYPTVPAWRSGLAYLYCELGRETEAQAEFERLAPDDFACLPRDGFWLVGFTLLAEVCASLGDASRAAMLYGQLLPYAGHCVVVGLTVACTGAVSRYLGLLATVMARWEDADRHFQDALEQHARMGALPYLAYTQHDYAKMLLCRGEHGDREKGLELLGEALGTAQQLGMKALEQRMLTLIKQRI